MRILLIFLFVFSQVNAFSQYNDTTNYHLLVTSGGSINKANNERAYLLNNALSFGLKKKSIVLNSSSAWLYGKQNSVLSNNDFSTTLNFNLYKTFPHFYYWGLANYNTSYSLKLKNQLLAGAGLAYSIVDREHIYINISDGVLFDQSSLIVGESYHTYRNSLRLQYHFDVRDWLTLDGNHFLQNSFSRKGDHIIRSNTSLGLKLRKWLSFTTTLTYNRLNITNSENLNLTYGLSLDKYF